MVMLQNINGMKKIQFGLDNNKIREKGITLLEALVATAIVGIGFIAVFQMVNYSVRSIDMSGERTKTNYLVEMVAEDVIGDRFTNTKISSTETKKTYEYLASLTDSKGSVMTYDKCKKMSSKSYSFFNSNRIVNKRIKWEHRFHNRIKCRVSSSGKTNEVKSLKVFEICRDNVKVNGKPRDNCSYKNNEVWNKTYIGRMQVKLNDGNKTKTLYFPIK